MRTAKMLKLSKRRTIRRIFGKRPGERGSALVEMALLLPLMTLMLLGAFEVALAVYTSIEVSSAALAGVQYGVQSAATAGDTQGIENAAVADAANVTLSTPTATKTCICSGDSNWSDANSSNCLPTACPGSQIETILTVQTQATFTPVIHFPGIPTSFTFNGIAAQKVLQ
jgi:Flp pilus assembly protein TadG